MLILGLVACSESGSSPDEATPIAGDSDIRDWEEIAATSTIESTESGKRLVQMCSGCHGIASGDLSPAGPTLNGFAGRQVGSVDGYPYTNSFSNRPERWSVKNFDRFIASPQDVYPGNGMAFAGISNAESRRDLIAYFAKLTVESNLLDE